MSHLKGGKHISSWHYLLISCSIYKSFLLGRNLSSGEESEGSQLLLELVLVLFEGGLGLGALN